MREASSEMAPSDPLRTSCGAGAVVISLATWSIAFLVALAVELSCYLWGQWRDNPDLSHGIFMPLVCALLLIESRRSGSIRFFRPGTAMVIATTLLALIALAGTAAAGLFAVSLGWSASIVGFTLTGAFASMLLAGILTLSGQPLAVVPLNWCSFCAAALWLLAAPMPPGTYSTLTLRLQEWVTGDVISALHLLGIAAIPHGNLIELARTTVGIEEACSGIRSLVSCVYAGLFLSAFLLRRPAARALLIILAAPLAIGMNFLRSLILTLLANAGVNIAHVWHDLTGFAILAITSAILLGIALILEPRVAAPPAPRKPFSGAISRPALVLNHAVLAVALLLAGALAVFFVAQTRPSSLARQPAPDLARLLPADPAGWHVHDNADLNRFSGTLETDDLVERTYYRESGGRLTQLTVYLAYWPPGRTSVSTVALHTPDACWPGAGWAPVPAAATRRSLAVGGRTLPPAESRIFTSNGVPQFVWFWHLYNGAVITQRDPRSVRELLAIAWRYGFRKDGSQVFVRVSSNHPWRDLSDEPLLTDLFRRLQTLGL